MTCPIGSARLFLPTKPRSAANRWGVILAGGAEPRARPSSEAISSDECPKQFCSVINHVTPLDRTRRRVMLGIVPRRTLVSVTHAHERYYAPALANMRKGTVLVQPEHRGTAPAILHALLRLAASAAHATRDVVAFFPANHHVSDDRTFMAHVEAAVQACLEWPDRVTLLGTVPNGRGAADGWIEPGDPIPSASPPQLYSVRSFREKPNPDECDRYRGSGWLLNSLVMVARVSGLLALIRRALPDLYRAFRPLRSTFGTVEEPRALDALYRGLPTIDFSTEVLKARPANLAVLPMR